MDLREKKTLRAISQAFLQLRGKKALERITVKELAELAEISKATFYLHYHDIYHLSQQMQEQLIQQIISNISDPHLFLTDQAAFVSELFQSFHCYQDKIDLLFSGSQASVLPLRIEKELSDYLFQLLPQARQDPEFLVMLTLQIQGGYYAYHLHHKQLSFQQIVPLIGSMAATAFPPLIKRFTENAQT